MEPLLDLPINPWKMAEERLIEEGYIVEGKKEVTRIYAANDYEFR